MYEKKDKKWVDVIKNLWYNNKGKTEKTKD